MKAGHDWRDEFLLQLRTKAKRVSQKIVVTEKTDARVIEAVCEAAAEGIANIILIGDKTELSKTIKGLGFEHDVVQVIDPLTDARTEYFSEIYQEREKSKGKNFLLDEAVAAMKEPSFFGAMLLKTGFADGMVCGATSPSSHVLRAAFKVGLNSGNKAVSGSMIMLMPSREWGHNGIMVFADVAVIPDPTSGQLVEIAYDTLLTAKTVTNIDPKVAMISFSSKGSAQHQAVSKVIDALALFNHKYPEVVIDGELQVDAAISPKVGQRKAPGSPVAGKANVLIFPDLNSANVACKLVEHLGGAKILGSIIQGLEKPVNDLSRGSDKEVIKNTIAVTALQIENKFKEKVII